MLERARSRSFRRTTRWYARNLRLWRGNSWLFWGMMLFVCSRIYENANPSLYIYILLLSLWKRRRANGGKHKNKWTKCKLDDLLIVFFSKHLISPTLCVDSTTPHLFPTRASLLRSQARLYSSQKRAMVLFLCAALYGHSMNGPQLKRLPRNSLCTEDMLGKYTRIAWSQKAARALNMLSLYFGTVQSHLLHPHL